MPITTGGFRGFPGYGAELETLVSQSGLAWGRPELLQYLPAKIAATSRDPGSDNTKILRPHLLLGKVAGENSVFKPWDPDATDGTAKICGILLEALSIEYLGVDQEKFTGYVVFSGGIQPSALQIPSESSAGIAGKADEYLVRNSLAPYFQLSDMPCSPTGGPITITDDVTLLNEMSGSTFNVVGTAEVEVTLPTLPRKGVSFTFNNLANQNLVFTSGSSNVIANNATVATIAYQTTNEKLGASAMIYGTGSNWVVSPTNGKTLS
jgi:hypothetical protein